MRRHVVVKPAWRARDGFLSRRRFPLINSISGEVVGRLQARAAAEGTSMRSLADRIMNRALDEAGAP